MFGSVALWGKVVEHTGGYCAEFAYPDRLRLACRMCLSIGRVGAPNVVIATSDDRVIPACDVHMRAVEGTSRDVADFQLELLSTYAVDLLPVEVLQEHGFTSGQLIPATPAGAGQEAIAKARSSGISSLFTMLVVVYFALKAVGIIGPGWVVEDATTPPPSPVVRADALSVAPLVTPAPESGRGGAAITGPRRDRPPQLRFVCGTEVTPGVVRLRACSSATTTVLGAAWSPAQPRARCSPGDAYTRKPRFSVCWLLIDGSGAIVDGSRRILRLPKAHWRDLE